MSQLVGTSVTVTGGPLFQAITPGTYQTVALSGSSAQSAALQTSTTLVRLISTVNCFVAFGSNPTASSSTMYLAAGVPEYFGVTPGAKIAGIQAVSSGSLYITEAA